MLARKEHRFEEQALDTLERHWKLIAVFVWLAFCAW